MSARGARPDRGVISRAVALLVGVLLALPAATSAWAGSAVGAEVSPAAEAGIASVVAKDTTVEVVGSAGAAGVEARIYALGTEADPESYPGADPVAAVTSGADGAFTASLPRVDRAGHDRLYDQYVAVTGEGDAAQVLGEPRHVDALDFTPARDFAYPRAASKKGLQVEMTDDAEELGVQHAGINVAFNEIMRIDAGDDPSKVIEFSSGGRSYYFDADAVATLDGQVKPLSDNGSLVNLILILYQDSDPTSAWPVLRHPDADVSSGTVFAFNTKTAEGVGYYTAAMEFLADRYTRDDEKYGRAVGYIVGNEVDAQWVWANAGDMTLEDFLGYYAKAVRIAWQATRKSWNGARTYISLTHCWTIVCGENPDPANPTRFYAGKDVIDQLNALTKRTGDVGWDIAHHPYPENLGDPAVWDDETALPGFDTPRITFKNIEVLPDYLARDDLGYAGASRRIILSEQGCHTPGDSLGAERLQAACYAYAYYKVRFLDSIDAFILHRHVDHQHEGGLRLGLWTWDDEREEPAMPGRHKVSYDVFEGIDTARSLEVTDFAKDVIGIDDWAEVVPGFDPDELADRTEPRQVGTRIAAKPLQETVIADFEDGVDGWRLSDNASAVESVAGGFEGDRALRVRFDNASQLREWSREAKTWKGTDVVLPEPVDARATPHLNLGVQVPEPGDFKPGNVFYVKVQVYSATGEVAYGLARLDPARGWNPLSLDLSGWAPRSAIGRIKVWVRGTTNDEWRGTFDVDHVTMSRKVAPASAMRNIDAVAELSDRSGVGSTLSVTVTSNDAKPLEGKVSLTACDGVAVEPAALDVAGLTTGVSRTYDTEVTAFEPADTDHPAICLDYGDATLRLHITVPPPVPTAVYDFEDGPAGWAPGQNVDSVATVESFANGPGSPRSGDWALEATTTPGPASAAKTVVVAPATPLDLSAATGVVAWVDAYGGAPGATGYEATLTLVSGEERLTSTLDSFKPDQWNALTVDVADWTHRGRITAIEIGFRALGTDAPWGARFQVDDVAYLH
ncbi:DUF5722 domain-containing protein [Actinopolymorpha sp. B11F2]|uniref:DUF5722 domain-containing protein n=1 Tax=Actinopolymorpha sp. B11F2 TaxID=3160862 RepID=UPI0032E530AF